MMTLLYAICIIFNFAGMIIMGSLVFRNTINKEDIIRLFTSSILFGLNAFLVVYMTIKFLEGIK